MITYNNMMINLQRLITTMEYACIIRESLTKLYINSKMQLGK